LQSEHILASTANSVFFPTVKIGKLHYGDGSIRLNAPLRAAIRLGAESILIISNRRVPKPLTITHVKPIDEISFATVLGKHVKCIIFR